MRQKNQVNPRQLVQVHCWIRLSSRRDAWTEMDVVSGVQEVGLILASP